MAININLNRLNLVNKRSVGEPITKEHIIFESVNQQSIAFLKESIWKENETFTTVTVYHNDTELIRDTDYTVQNEASTITLLGVPEDNNYYATYTGGGSIIWAQDVNELQTAVQTIATDALDKTGDTMSGMLNMNNNIITNVNTVNGVKIETHNHSNGQGGLIPSSGIEDDAITTSKIASQAVETNKIKDLAITNEKIKSVDISKVDGLLDQVANRYLTNLYNGLENVVCTENPTTSTTATIKKPVVISDAYRDSTTGSWYNIYSNGAIEMGGIVHVGTDSTAPVTFPNGIILTDTKYSVQLTLNSSTTTMNNTSAGSIWYNAKTISGFTILNDLWDGDVSWEVKGVVTGTQRIPLYTNNNIVNGTNTINSLYTHTFDNNAELEINIAGACGYFHNAFGSSIIYGSSSLVCSKTVNIGDTIEVKSINCYYQATFSGYVPGVSVILYHNDTPVIVAGGGAWCQAASGAYLLVGGSGNVGGLADNRGHSDWYQYNGFSINGTQGSYNSDIMQLLDGANFTPGSYDVKVYGGSGSISNTVTIKELSTNSKNAYINLYQIS